MTSCGSSKGLKTSDIAIYGGQTAIRSFPYIVFQKSNHLYFEENVLGKWEIHSDTLSLYPQYILDNYPNTDSIKVGKYSRKFEVYKYKIKGNSIYPLKGNNCVYTRVYGIDKYLQTYLIQFELAYPNYESK